MANHVIYDKLWRSKKLPRCSKQAALAYPWIYLVADDWGRFEFDPRVIRGTVFGGRDDISLRDVERWLAEYETVGLLVKYEARGAVFCGWTRFKGKSPSRRRSSEHPAPPPAIQALIDIKEDTPDGPTDYEADCFTPEADCSLEVEKEVEVEKEGGVGEGTGAAAATPPVIASVRKVFDHWQRVMDKPLSKLIGERERAVRARLKDGYTVEQLCRAIDGARASPYHRGANETQTVYDELELICRKGSHVERFMGYLRQPGNGATALAPARASPPTPKEQKRRDVLAASIVGGMKGDGTLGGKGRS